MGEACAALGTPVTGGNVSLYNESPTGAVYPTPTIGMVGLLERRGRSACPATSPRRATRSSCSGDTTGELGGSEYWAEVRRLRRRDARRRCDLDAERRLAAAAAWPPPAPPAPLGARLLRGRAAVALAEAAIGGPYAAAGLGATLDLTTWAPGVTPEGLLYGEDGARVVVSADPREVAALLALAGEHGVPAHRAGRVGDPDGDPGTSGGQSAVLVGHRRTSADLFHGDSQTDAASGRGPLGGRVRHVRHHRRLRAA